MAVTLNAKGTTENTFTVGKQGPKIKNNSGVIELRNATDTAFVNFQSLGIDDNASETVITIDIDETVQIHRNQADAAELLTLIQDNAGATGDVIAIGNDGTGDAIEIVNTGDARAIFIDTAATSANAIEVLNQFVVSSIATPANYIKITAATIGNVPSIVVDGSDVNADVQISAKGNGSILLGDTSTGGNVSLSTTDAVAASGTDGYAFSFSTGNGDGIGAGGNINLIAGNGGTTGDGGDIVLTPGSKGVSGTNNGAVIIGGKVNLLPYNVVSLPNGQVGDMVYCLDGDAGSPCLAVYNGTNWKVVAFGATASAT